MSIVDPLNQVFKIFPSNRESSDPFAYIGVKISSLLLSILEYSESTYLNLHHIFFKCARSTHEESVIYLNKAMLTVIYELASGSYLKFLMLTTYDDSDSFGTIFSETVNDLHAVVSNFSKSYRNQMQCSCYIFFKDLKISPIVNVGYSVNYKHLIF